MPAVNDHDGPRWSSKSVCAVWLMLALVAGLLSTPLGAADLADLLADDDDHARWQIAGDRAELRIDDEAYAVDLLFALEKLGDEPIDLTIETDAERLELRSDYRRVRLALGEPGEHRLTLRAAADQPTLQLNGEAVDADAQSDWRRLLDRTDKPVLTLRLRQVSRARITLGGDQTTRPDGPPSLDQFGLIPLNPDTPGMTDPATAPPNADDAPAPPGLGPELTDAALVERARRATLWIEAPIDDQSVARLAQAVAVGKPGQLLMPASMLGQASAVQARIDPQTTVDVSIIALDAANDLALGQLDLADAKWRGRVVSLAVGQATAELPIAAVRMDRRWQLQLARGSIIQTHLTETLDQADRNRLGAPENTNWLSLNVAVPATGSGGAVLNNQGQLVGLAAWSCPSLDQRTDTRRSTYPSTYRRSGDDDEPSHRGWALSAATVSALLSRPDQTPMTLDQIKTTLAASQMSHYRLPLLRVTEPVSPTQLQRAVNAIDQLLLCPLCKGRGVVTQRQRTGYRTEGTYRIPVYEEVEQACPRCAGSKLNSEQVIQRAVGQVAHAAARADQADPRYEQVAPHAVDKLHSLPGEHLPALADQFNQQALRSLAAGSLRPGDPVSVVGAVIPDGLGEHERASVKLIRLVGASSGAGIDDQQAEPAGFAILVQPDLVDPQIESTVWAGGLFAGLVHTGEGQLVPVIHGGFAIAADSALLPRDTTARTYRRQFHETGSTGEGRPERR